MHSFIYFGITFFRRSIKGLFMGPLVGTLAVSITWAWQMNEGAAIFSHRVKVCLNMTLDQQMLTLSPNVHYHLFCKDV